MEKNVLKLSPSPWHLGLRYYCLASICTYVWFHDELSRGFCVEQKYVIQWKRPDHNSQHGLLPLSTRAEENLTSLRHLHSFQVPLHYEGGFRSRGGVTPRGNCPVRQWRRRFRRQSLRSTMRPRVPPEHHLLQADLFPRHGGRGALSWTFRHDTSLLPCQRQAVPHHARLVHALEMLRRCNFPASSVLGDIWNEGPLCCCHVGLPDGPRIIE